jgi:hypothetical protein
VQDLNAFNQVLESADQVDFAIALAALASKENLVILDVWLKTQIQMKGDLFIEVTLMPARLAFCISNHSTGLHFVNQ